MEASGNDWFIDESVLHMHYNSELLSRWRRDALLLILRMLQDTACSQHWIRSGSRALYCLFVFNLKPSAKLNHEPEKSVSKIQNVSVRHLLGFPLWRILGPQIQNVSTGFLLGWVLGLASCGIVWVEIFPYSVALDRLADISDGVPSLRNGVDNV